jgi:phosphatidylinositol glycan class B
VESPATAPIAPLSRALDRLDEGRVLAAAIALGLLFTVAAALLSDSVFQVDEHFQVVEFVGLKLGATPASALPWEHAARIRPWMQPGAYALLGRGLGAVGVTDPFVLLRAFRLASGLLAWSALAALLLAVRAWLPSARWRRVAYLSLALPYFVPYLAARLSSESGATTFLVLSLAALLPLVAVPGEAQPGRGVSLGRLVVAGAALGLAFEMRYQTGAVAAGLLLWVLVHGRDRWRTLGALLCGMAFPLALGLVVDAWGYGSFEVVPWRYLSVNLIEGKAASFGTSPLPAYLWFLAGLFPPFGLALLLGLLLFWWRFPRNLLTWATLPFVALHSMIGHKEIRFLFPVLPAAAVCVILLLAAPPPDRRWERWASRAMGFLWLGRVTWGLNAAALLLLCLLPSTDNLELQRFFHRHAAEPVRWVALADPRSFHGAAVPFLWPRPMPPVEVVVDTAGLTAALAGGTGPVIVTAKHPLPPGAEALLAQRGSRIFSSLPPWLARVNLFHWLDRADMTYAWRVDRPAAPRRRRGRRPRPQGLTAQPGRVEVEPRAAAGDMDLSCPCTPP